MTNKQFFLPALYLMAAVSLLTLPVPSAFANSGSGTWVVTVSGVPSGDTLKLRKKPKATAPILHHLSNGDQGFINIYDCWNASTGKKIPSAKVGFKKPNTWCGFLMADDVDNPISGYVRTKYLQ